jgi:hypothetical protein
MVAYAATEATVGLADLTDTAAGAKAGPAGAFIAFAVWYNFTCINNPFGGQTGYDAMRDFSYKNLGVG